MKTSTRREKGRQSSFLSESLSAARNHSQEPSFTPGKLYFTQFLKNMKTTTFLKGIICTATLIQCIHSYAAVPADYRGTPFDDAAYREEQKALADKKKPLPSDFVPAQVVWDSKTAVVGSGWIGQGTASSIALGEKDAEGRQFIHYRSKNYKYESFGWKWAKPEEPAVDLTKFDAVSFAIKFSGPHLPEEFFFTITMPTSISKRWSRASHKSYRKTTIAKEKSFQYWRVSRLA